MNILITGGNGLVGSNLYNKLRETTSAEDIGRVDIDTYDLANKNDIERLSHFYHPDVIIHTAAIAHIPAIKKNPFKAINNNILSTINLLEFAMRRKVKHFIFLSSCSVYGDTSPLGVDESLSLKPKGIYGVTKVCEETLVTACGKQLGLSTTILRLSSVYGPGDKHSRVVPNFIKAALSGKPLIVEGEVRKEFTYVDDVVDAIMLCLGNKKSKGEIFNIHGGEAHSIFQLAGAIKRLVPKAQIIYKPADREQTDRGNISIQKAKGILGYEPKVKLEEGLRRMIQ